MTAVRRVAVVGGHGKTGRAVAAALTDRGAEAVATGRAEWDRLERGPRRLRRRVRRRAQPAPGRAGVRRARAGRRPGGRGRAGRLPLGRVAVRARDAAPPRQGRGGGRRTPLRAALDDPAAGRLPAEPRPDRHRPAALPRGRAVRLRRPRRRRRRWPRRCCSTTATRARPTSWRRSGRRVADLAAAAGVDVVVAAARPGRAGGPRGRLAAGDVRLLRRATACRSARCVLDALLGRLARGSTRRLEAPSGPPSRRAEIRLRAGSPPRRRCATA